MILIYLSCAWVAGTFLGLNYSITPALIFIGFIPLPLLLIARQHRNIIILTSLCLITFFCGTFRSQSSLPSFDENHLRFYNDQGTIEIKGLVNRDPEPSEKTTRLYLSVNEIKIDKEWHDISGTALLFVPRYPAYEYGDMLLVRGELETPPRKLDEFNYRDYLAHQGIFSTMLYPEIEILERGIGFKPLEWVYSLRNRLSQTLVKVLPEPQASLAQGIILGIRGNIPSPVKDDFIHTGTAHLLAISGIHLSILAGTMLSFGTWLFGRKGYIYIWLALGVIWLYALLTGAHPPVLRAAIMASLFLTTDLLGRQRSAITALVFAAAVMVGISPQVLQDAAFQMSFVSMAGLIFIFPLIQSLGRKAVNAALGEEGAIVSVANFISDSFSVNLGAIIAVWPLVVYYYGIISWAAPLATFFVLLALSGLIITGVLAGVMGFFALPIAQAIGWLAWLFTSYMLFVVNAFTAIPSIKTGSVDIALICVYYAALVLLIWVTSNRKKVVDLMPRAAVFISRIPKKWIIYPLVVVAILVSVTAATMPDDNLRVSFFNVGQGDAILIQKGSQQILVDGGPSPQEIGLALSQKMPFWDRTIELVVLTHPHKDHISGLVEVLNKYEIKEVLHPDFKCDSPLCDKQLCSDLGFSSDIYDEWLQIIEEKNIKYTPVQFGQQISLGDVIIEVLNPQICPLTNTESDIDNNGVVLRLEMDKVSFLLTADIMWQAEYELITDRANLTSTVLKVAHHGSATSTTSEFLAVVNPQIAVISYGKDNPFGHPSKEVTDRLEQLLSADNIYYTDTDEHGTIEFITDGKRLWVRVDKNVVE